MDARRFFSIASTEPPMHCGRELATAELDAWFEALARSLGRAIEARRPLAAVEPGVLAPPELLDALGARLGLTAAERRAMALALAPVYSPRVAALYGALVERDSPSELTAEVLGALEGCSAFVLRQRHPGLLVEPGALLRMGLLSWHDGALVETSALRAMLFERTGVDREL